MITTTDTWTCSFCGAQGGSDRRLAGGRGAMICADCLARHHDDFSSDDGVLQMSGSPVRELTNEDMLSRLPQISAEAAQVDRFLRAWVGLIRERQMSYAEIGKALGVSRQAAWERFSRNAVPPVPAAAADQSA